jgi:hypothetical protein
MIMPHDIVLIHGRVEAVLIVPMIHFVIYNKRE